MQQNQHATVLRGLIGKQVVSYHPDFAKAFRSVPAALFLSQALFLQDGAKYKELFIIDGREYFTATAAEIYDATGLTTDAQETARRILKSLGLLYEAKKGIPAKLYYCVDFEQLVEIMSDFYAPKQVSGNPRNSVGENPETVLEEIPKQQSGNPPNYIIEDSFESLESLGECDAALPLRVEIHEPAKVEFFNLEENENTPPPPVAPAPPAPRKKPGSRTAAELDQVGEVVEYLNTQAGTRYRANTGETAKLICGRLKDGYTVEDLKNVVAYKCVQWLGSDMQVHLCPATLFRPANFEKYYNAAKMPAPKAKQEPAPVGTPSALPNVRRL